MGHGAKGRRISPLHPPFHTHTNEPCCAVRRADLTRSHGSRTRGAVHCNELRKKSVMSHSSITMSHEITHAISRTCSSPCRGSRSTARGGTCRFVGVSELAAVRSTDTHTQPPMRTPVTAANCVPRGATRCRGSCLSTHALNAVLAAKRRCRPSRASARDSPVSVESAIGATSET